MSQAKASPATEAPQRPTFKEPPIYRVMEKAYMSGIKIKQGNDWVPYDDVLLDPEAQPLANQLSGPYDGKAGGERVPLIIEFRGIPADHLEPMNEAARWVCDHIDELKRHAEAEALKSRKKRGSPIDALTIVGPGAVVLNETRESV
jgi:hypothetical protein